MEELQDPDERVADLERRLAEAKAAARRAQASGASARPTDTSLAPTPRKVPATFWLAELLPFRWWYGWTLFMIAVTPIVLWIPLPRVFAAVALLTLAAI